MTGTRSSGISFGIANGRRLELRELYEATKEISTLRERGLT